MIVIGLDWHSQVKMTEEERLERARELHKEYYQDEELDDVLEQYTSEWKKPCQIVGASKMKDSPTFKEDVRQYVEEMKESAKEKVNEEHPNQTFIDHWLSRTVEEEVAECADKWNCDNCPLIEELQGSDSTESFFVGLTVSSCDFRGKLIGRDEDLDEELRYEAYEDHDPEEMLDYADRLEKEIERQRKTGGLEKDSYKEYSDEWENSSWPFKGSKMTEEVYEKTLHWTEENLRRAIHWLRTCAKHGASMGTSY